MIQKNINHPSSTYRADIDGLRAISILFVIISHTLGVAAGDTGVDIFFVISGYVITMTIVKDFNEGTFSFKNFYYRRIKRILPVLYVSSAVFLLMVYFFFEKYLRLTSQHALCSVLMIQNFCLLNFYQNQQPGIVYEGFPLMSQNWTLGIQQQFYLIWPLIMACLIKKQQKFRILMAGILAALSFMLMIGPINYNQRQLISFARFWEIFAGCFLALCEFDTQKPTINKTELKELDISGNILPSKMLQIQQSVDGPQQKKLDRYQVIYIVFNVGLIAYVFTPKSHLVSVLFYVLWTMIIIKNKDTMFNTRFLASKPMVFVGKISYSVYIWHQSVITTFKEDQPILSVLLIVIGILCYNFIQNKLRRARHPIVVPAILIFGGVVLIASVAFRFG